MGDEERTSLLPSGGAKSDYQAVDGTSAKGSPLTPCLAGSSVPEPFPTVHLHHTTHPRVYKRRFYILAVFSLFAAIQNGTQNTYSPVAEVEEDMFGWKNSDIAILANWGSLTIVLGGFIFSWIMHVKGMRMALLISGFLLVQGTGLRCVSVSGPAAPWFAHIGQFVAGLAGPVAMAGPPVLSSLWFPAGQRTIATGLISTVSYTGYAVSFLVGPYMVPVRPSEVHPNRTRPDNLMSSLQAQQSDENIEAERQDFLYYMIAGWLIPVAVMVAMLAYFPDRPPTPPSTSATIPRDSYITGLLELTRNGPFLAIAVGYSVVGVGNSWSGVLDVNLKDHDISQKVAGWIGFSTIAFACVLSLIIPALIERAKHLIKWCIVAQFSGALACFVCFTLGLAKVVPLPAGVLYVTVVGGGALIISTIPLFFELGCELAYPVGEETANITITVANNIVCVIFTYMLLIPNIGTMWMNWTTIASLALAIPLLIFTKTRLRRLDVDLGDRALSDSSIQT